MYVVKNGGKSDDAENFPVRRYFRDARAMLYLQNYPDTVTLEI